MKIEVELENTEKYPNADYGIVITKDGQRITSYATWMYLFDKQYGYKKMHLNIPSLKFSPGTYRIDLSSAFHAAGEVLDRVESASTFHLESADIFKSGKSFTSDYGLLAPEGELVML